MQPTPAVVRSALSQSDCLNAHCAWITTGLEEDEF